MPLLLHQQCGAYCVHAARCERTCAQNIKCLVHKCAIWNTPVDRPYLLLEECKPFVTAKQKKPYISMCHTQDVQQGRAQSGKKNKSN